MLQMLAHFKRIRWKVFFDWLSTLPRLVQKVLNIRRLRPGQTAIRRVIDLRRYLNLLRSRPGMTSILADLPLLEMLKI